MTRKLIALSAGVIFALLLGVGRVRAQGAYFYFSPDKIKANKGEVFVAKVLINTGGYQINTASVHISYPSERLEFLTSSFSVATFNSVIERSETKGELKYSAYVRPYYQGKEGLVVELRFKALESGTVEISFLPTSNAYVADGKGSPVLSFPQSTKLNVSVSSMMASGETSESMVDQTAVAKEEVVSGVVDYTKQKKLAEKSEEEAEAGEKPAGTKVTFWGERGFLVLIFVLLFVLILVVVIIGIMIKKLVEEREF